MSRQTELIALSKDTADDPRFAVCYGRGSVFRPDGHFFRVEKGKRSLVSRTLCTTQHFGSRCRICPNSSFTVVFVARGGDGTRP
jgi:hypothetical protein